MASVKQGGNEMDSMNDETITVSIGNVADGAMVVAFERALNEVLKNIADPNTPATQSRSIVLRLKIKPKDDRVQLSTEFTCESKLASITPNQSRMFLGRDKEGALYALLGDPRQLNIFTPPKPVSVPEPIQFKR